MQSIFLGLGVLSTIGLLYNLCGFSVYMVSQFDQKTVCLGIAGSTLHFSISDKAEPVLNDDVIPPPDFGHRQLLKIGSFAIDTESPGSTFRVFPFYTSWSRSPDFYFQFDVPLTLIVLLCAVAFWRAQLA